MEWGDVEDEVGWFVGKIPPLSLTLYILTGGAGS